MEMSEVLCFSPPFSYLHISNTHSGFFSFIPQEQMKIAFREIFQMMKEPMLTIKNAITDVIGKIKRSLLKVRKVFVRIKELVMKIGKYIFKQLMFSQFFLPFVIRISE